LEKIDAAQTDINVVRHELTTSIAAQTEATAELKEFVNNDVNTKLTKLKDDSDASISTLFAGAETVSDTLKTLEGTVAEEKESASQEKSGQSALATKLTLVEKMASDSKASLAELVRVYPPSFCVCCLTV
jgi:hypothetical protein